MNFSKITTKTARLALLSALTVMAIVSVSQHAAAQLVIDNFSSGFYSKSLSTGSAYDTQTGTMAGGSRTVYLGVCEPTNPCDGNPFEQPNSYQIKKATKTTPNILIFNTGYDSDANLQIAYGDSGTMLLDLSPYDRIRLYFNGADQVVNFNLAVYYDGTYSSIGCNITNPGEPDAAFTVDLPFANFSGGDDFSDVNLMGFAFGVSQGTGTGVDWGITSIQAVNGVTGNPVICGSSGSVTK